MAFNHRSKTGAELSLKYGSAAAKLHLVTSSNSLNQKSNRRLEMGKTTSVCRRFFGLGIGCLLSSKKTRKHSRPGGERVPARVDKSTAGRTVEKRAVTAKAGGQFQQQYPGSKTDCRLRSKVYFTAFECGWQVAILGMGTSAVSDTIL